MYIFLRHREELRYCSPEYKEDMKNFGYHRLENEPSRSPPNLHRVFAHNQDDILARWYQF